MISVKSKAVPHQSSGAYLRWSAATSDHMDLQCKVPLDSKPHKQKFQSMKLRIPLPTPFLLDAVELEKVLSGSERSSGSGPSLHSSVLSTDPKSTKKIID